MSKVKSVENYFMNLNGFAYDPMKEGRNIYIKVVNLENHDHKVLFNIINRKTAVVNMSTMSVNELNQDFIEEIFK